MLAERDLIFGTGIPAELERARRITDTEYERTQARIAGLSPGKDSEQIDRLLAQLQELRGKQVDIRERIRKASPRLAALQYPQPLDLEAVQRSLDPGTLMLSYLVMEQKTFLFVVPAAKPRAPATSRMSVIELPIGDRALRAKVEQFRKGIQDPTELGDAWVHQSKELYTLLIEPATRWIAASDRLVISPDGPLHVLPFGALVTEESISVGGRTRPRFWIERKPLHVVGSGTLYAELKKGRRQSGVVSLVAFGDPKYPVLSKEPGRDSRQSGSAVGRARGICLYAAAGHSN
jgi:hypothetical protein